MFRANSPVNTTLKGPCEFWNEKGRAGLIPLSEGTYVFLVMAAPRGTTMEEIPEFFYEVFGEEVAQVIRGAKKSDFMQHDIDYLSGSYWGNRKVILLGDAAHGFTPNMGQGACQAIADAMVLADCITSDTVGAYAGLRSSEVRRIAFMSNLIGQIAHVESRPVRAVVNAVLRAASIVMPAR